MFSKIQNHIIDVHYLYFIQVLAGAADTAAVVVVDDDDDDSRWRVSTEPVTKLPQKDIKSYHIILDHIRYIISYYILLYYYILYV